MNDKRKLILSKFPLFVSGYRIEVLNKNDLVERSKWPSYKEDFIIFNLVIRSNEELENKFQKYDSDSRMAFSIFINNNLIGILSFNKIDWTVKEINDMTIRIHPNYCNKGIGKKMLTKLCEFMFENEFHRIKLDVNAKNIQAQKCYINSGFKIIEEEKKENKIHYIMEKRFG